MDASATPKVNTDPVCSFFIKIENAAFPTTVKQRNTIIKYTKLPDYDFDTKVVWPSKSYTLPSRLRRIIALDEPDVTTTRSLKMDYDHPPKISSASFTRRKIVTISEDDENDLNPKFSSDIKRSASSCKSNRAVTADLSQAKLPSQRNISRLSTPKYSRNAKSVTKINNNNKDANIPIPSKKKVSNINVQAKQNNKVKEIKEKEISKQELKPTLTNVSKFSLSKNIICETENYVKNNKNKLSEKSNAVARQRESVQYSNNQKRNLPPTPQCRNRPIVTNKPRMKSYTTIEVPLNDPEARTQRVIESEIRRGTPLIPPVTVDCGTDSLEIDMKHIQIGTEPPPKQIDQTTEITNIDFPEPVSLRELNQPLAELTINTFDSLEIPNVTLTKDISDNPKEELVNFCSHSLTNLNLPAPLVSMVEEPIGETISVQESSSCIIGRATLTYTTKQQIDIHVVGNNEVNTERISSSPLSYPLNVVSVFKNEIENAIDLSSVDNKEKNESNVMSDDMKSLNCSYAFDCDRLVKPSDIISTIRVNNDLLQSEYVCEQFQRELNFIDSFFESLQYLESCSLSDKCFTNNKVENWVSKSGFDVNTPEYDSFFSKLENGEDVDDSETMASKSLCLLNLLIRDEQRRAKNLLFVLKMREDALKDFTKSQILWLENKKKQENTDISTLKKKQRGALLKLQHECGEMQRMRKALLALSEKRKVALMKTKKNIELKLKNNVGVDQIVLGKKKVKRNLASSSASPLKCFDLSSSGCEERPPPPPPPLPVSRSAEKCVQTTDSVLGPAHVDRATDTAAENYIVVDGSYLNILFHNLSLPQIFSSGKQYEVNEEALRNIVTSANTYNRNFSEGDAIEKFMDHVKNRETDKSSSPSTARSLVEEFDQYYKGLAEEDNKSPTDTFALDYRSPMVYELDQVLQEPALNLNELGVLKSSSTMTCDSAETMLCRSSAVDEACSCENLQVTVETQSGTPEPEPLAVPGPLVVPLGDPVISEHVSDDSRGANSPKSSTSLSGESTASSNLTCPSISSMTSLSSPVHCEAEELRRQQLAIEREIKALEQQQLLVVREIPDKPPPPYTPPHDSRTKPQFLFTYDEKTDEKIHSHIISGSFGIDCCDNLESFDMFIHDFCEEAIRKNRTQRSNKPWDTCNQMPQKPPIGLEALAKKKSEELKEVLGGVVPTVVTGVGARRSDHIDDILFTEWKRCEPEWTALHSDEVMVKNQIFESIFQKILSETVDEYKKVVPGSSD